MQLLTQNSDLKRTGIYGWTLPAHWVTMDDGSKVNTCPNAGICAAFCYAKTGTFKFSNVLKAHREKLDLVMNHRDKWISMMNEELNKPKYIGKYIRIHDAGDFYSIDYAVDWLNIAKINPEVNFYAYTKEVDMFKTKLAQLIPTNFILIYSFGGKQDKMIDRDKDRHSDVFYDYNEMIKAGYNDIGNDDKQAAIHPNHKVGLFRNNLPHLIKKQGARNFSDWQSGHKSEAKKIHFSHPKKILLIGATGTGKTWVMEQLLLKYKCNRRAKLGKFYFHRNDNLVIVGKYDGSTFQGSDRLSMSVVTDLDKFLQYSSKDFVLLEGDRFTNKTVIKAAEPIIIRIMGNGADGRFSRGSEQTDRQIKSIHTRVHNIELPSNGYEVQNSTEALELITKLIDESNGRS